MQILSIKRFCLGAFALVTLFTAAAAGPSALPFVSPIFSDNLVLQRGKPNPIWGWAKPGEIIKVSIAGHTAKAVADAGGRWQTDIKPPEPGGPYTLRIVGPDQAVEFHEVLVGDVWLCGGQSNMELGIGLVNNPAEEVKDANHPEIRLFLVNHKVSYSPAQVPDANGGWKICSPQTISEGGWGGFSAVAYFFGRRLQQDTHVPVGLIEDCVGGSPVESWTSPAALHKAGGYDPQLAEIERLSSKPGPRYGSFLMHWLDEYDIGISNQWALTDRDDSAWQTVHIPGAFEEMGLADVPCVCWFRKEIVLPDPLPAGQASIHLGWIEKMDTTYINGHWVGASSWVEHNRDYEVPRNDLKPGTNLVTLSIFKFKSKDSFLSKSDEMHLNVGDTIVPLAGEWKGKLSFNAQSPHPMPLDFENYPTMPAVLYLGMIEPVAPLAIKGAIWYQGEANFTQAYRYRTLLPAMIDNWRNLFGQGDFPFYIVGLPAFMQHRSEPGTDGWAELREAQALTAQNVPDCGLAITVDTGDADNIHPKNKVPVGDRLAYCALAETYREKIPYQGPTYTSMQRLPGALKLNFAHTDGGLVVKGDKLGEFSIAGQDRKWRWADARIVGDSVVVSSPQVPDPVAARYAWQANPLATLYNGAGLPAVPFRTDDWPESTQNK
ncbi:MAG TPA: sialate O-acetylesterase [Verrucomicrobiae bacterium]|nr:sialate O-acetylesterase [Verrucomicrobiae bacterium]